MKILVVFFAAVLMVALGCSSDDSAKADDTKAGADSADVKGPMTAEDSLAAMTYPIRNENNQIVTMETNYGTMILELYRDVAPAHADSFAARTADGFYDSLTFHRIIPNFMIQGGDPKGDGTGNAGYYLRAEFSDLPHKEGTLSMARGGDPNSASCQFFICTARSRNNVALDGKYTVFGHLLKGYDVLHAIEHAETTMNKFGQKTQPASPVIMTKVYLSDADGNPVSE